MGSNPFESCLQLWQKKLGLLPPIELNDNMRRGIEQEPIARQRACEVLNMPFEPTVVFHPKYHWMMASLDGKFENKIIEIKCPSKKKHEEFKYLQTVPSLYYAQLQHHMMCADVGHIYFMSWFDGDLDYILVQRNTEYIEELIEREKWFYQHLMDLTEPIEQYY